MEPEVAVPLLIAGVAIGSVFCIRYAWLGWNALRKGQCADSEDVRQQADALSGRYIRTQLVIAVWLFAYVVILAKLTSWE